MYNSCFYRSEYGLNDLPRQILPQCGDGRVSGVVYGDGAFFDFGEGLIHSPALGCIVKAQKHQQHGLFARGLNFVCRSAVGHYNIRARVGELYIVTVRSEDIYDRLTHPGIVYMRNIGCASVCKSGQTYKHSSTAIAKHTVSETRGLFGSIGISALLAQHFGD